MTDISIQTTAMGLSLSNLAICDIGCTKTLCVLTQSFLSFITCCVENQHVQVLL